MKQAENDKCKMFGLVFSRFPPGPFEFLTPGRVTGRLPAEDLTSMLYSSVNKRFLRTSDLKLKRSADSDIQDGFSVGTVDKRRNDAPRRTEVSKDHERWMWNQTFRRWSLHGNLWNNLKAPQRGVESLELEPHRLITVSGAMWNRINVD